MLDNSGFESEIFYTEHLIKLFESHPGIQDTYREDLFLQSVEQIIIKEEKMITFRLKNKLELFQKASEGRKGMMQRHMPMGYRMRDGKIFLE